MGIRESLLNTITSVGNSDFVRIVTSAGASSKATLQNVIKSFETGLGAKSSLTTSDYIRVVGSDNNLYKQSVSSVMQMMGIEDVVNGTRGQIGSLPNGNIDDFATDKIYGTYYLNNSDSDITGTKPDTSGQGLLFCKQQSSAIYRQIYIGVASSSAMKVRYYYNNAWTQWSNLPIRSEIDTLNSNTTKHDITTYVDLASYTSTWYTFPTDGYLTASCGSASNAIAVGRVGGSSLNATLIIGGYGNSTYGSWSCFVRAGMKAQAVRLENGGTLYFRPLS